MTTQVTPMTLARRAGFLYFLLVPLGIFGLIYVPELIYVEGNAAQTLANITANESLYRWAIIAALAIQVVQLFVALALYDLLKPAGKRMASLIVLFTLAAMPIAMLNELNHVAVLYLINGAPMLDSFSQVQIEQWATVLLNLNLDGIMIAHVFWGFWLFPMGYLISKSGIIPKPIGWLFVFACFGYLADTFIWLILPESTFTVATFTGWGEIILPLWLIFKGANSETWHRINDQSKIEIA
jgi:hypothetical protein